jgi:hypothetical protein
MSHPKRGLIRISKEIENIMSQIAMKEKELHYSPKNNETKGRASSEGQRHWNKCVNEWIEHRVCLAMG